MSMEMSLPAMSFLVFYGVFIFFFGRMLIFCEHIYITSVESRSLAAVEGRGYVFERFTDIIEFGAWQVLLHDVRKPRSRAAAAQKDKYRQQSHGFILS